MSYTPTSVKTFRVAEKGGDFSTLKACIDYLGTLSSTEGVRIVVDGGKYDITDTITINLTMPITIEGSGAYSSLFQAATGLLNKDMFIIKTDCSFQKVGFRGDTLANWSTGSTATFLKYDTDNVYSEIIDFSMDTAKCGIKHTSTSFVFGFNFVISNCVTGIEVSASTKTPDLDIEVGNFESCPKGVDIISGTSGDIYLNSIRFIHASTEVGLTYAGSTFTYNNFSILNCEHNHIGTFFSGFDFTLVRDADIEILNCIGTENKCPHAKINVEGSVTTQALTSNTWTKSNFTNSNIYTNKWTIENNKVTFQSNHEKDVTMWISANILTTTQPSEIRIAIVKNGVSATQYGRMGLFADLNSRPFHVTTNVYLDDVKKNDYFEIWLYAVGSNETIVLQDLTWLIDSK